MGSGAIELILKKEGMELVGVISKRADRNGKDVGEILGRDKPLGIRVFSDAGELFKSSSPDAVVQCTTSTVKDAFGEIETALRHGINVVSIAEEMSFPHYGSPELSEKIDRLARDTGVTVLGTGINPGFVLDLLVIALTGVCSEVHSITARRVNDLSPYGPSVLRTQGVGIIPEEFQKGIEDGSVVGHFGFPESIGMIGKALGWKIDRIEQTREPIISSVKRETKFIKVEPGMTCGCHHRGIGYMGEKAAIILDHPQQIHPHLEGVVTGDYIDIKGVPDVSFSGSPEIPGGVGTVALSVNMIPKVINAPPGLMTMADMPVPAAIMGDVREMIKGGK
ncbi:MAG: NADP-binding protein [Deltaproteobacteria bacterium]|uniref:NADP-binding protein n=1 Tax=Candidatus Zymogenus saltonus TaxID=2844893 RepID=A0A9D8PMP5_9DELT|nr:NADP-binding protein [Candidatus Zymogenus saltonus]